MCEPWPGWIPPLYPVFFASPDFQETMHILAKWWENIYSSVVFCNGWKLWRTVMPVGSFQKGHQSQHEILCDISHTHQRQNNQYFFQWYDRVWKAYASYFEKKSTNKTALFDLRNSGMLEHKFSDCFRGIVWRIIRGRWTFGEAAAGVAAVQWIRQATVAD